MHEEMVTYCVPCVALRSVALRVMRCAAFELVVLRHTQVVIVFLFIFMYPNNTSNVHLIICTMIISDHCSY